MNDPDGVFEARAYIHGNKVIVRADHLEFSSMQLLKHELGHHKIRTGKVDMKKVYDAIEDFATEGYAQYVIESYVNAYATLEGYDADYILEEILCDYEAGMNIFSEEDASSLFWEMAQEVLQSDAVKADPVRGPPVDGDIEFSREPRKVKTFLRHFTGEVREGEYIYLSNVEKATIKSNIKTGFGHISPDAKRGIVSAHDRSKEYTYRFVCNADHSVTVIDVFDPETDKQLIDAIWRDFHNVRFSKESNGRAGSRQRNSDLHSDGLQKAQPMERTAEMAGGTPEGNRKRNSGSSGENRTNSGADTSRDTSEIKFSSEATEEQLQEDKNNGRRKESAEDFDRRTSEELLTKGQKGRLAYAYRPYLGTPSQSAQAAREGLKIIGVPVIIFERLEGNKGNETTMYNNDATTIPGIAVFIHKDATIDSLEIVGHEGFHFLATLKDRARYTSVLIDNIDFASAEFIAYQTKYVQEKYFEKEVGTESDDFYLLAEEIFAYITGDIHNGDPKGEVHKFLRDYDSVKAAWDALVESQKTNQPYRMKFSREFIQAQMTEKEMLLEKANRMLERENGKLREDNQYLKELVKIQKSLTGGMLIHQAQKRFTACVC